MSTAYVVNPSRKTNIRYITPLFRLCTILCIIPPYDFRNYRFSINFTYKLYRAAVISFLLGGFVFCFMSKIYNTFDLIQKTVVVVNVLAYISFFLINITSLSSANFGNFKSLEKFLNELVSIDRRLVNFGNFKSLEKFLNELVSIDRRLVAYHISNKTKSRTFIWVELFLNHCLLFFVMLFDALVTKLNRGLLYGWNCF
ncbi:hypothetical protein QE152_g26018 [Popillia japonica]|uniref:Uncharacterized protein n=1 Tax=Popillia japonica TaxID=7064 RepID=A0AAW1K040_POPJA